MASDCFFCTNSFVPALLLYRCPDDAMLLWGWNTSEPRTQWGGYYPNPVNSLLNKHWTTAATTTQTYRVYLWTRWKDIIRIFEQWARPCTLCWTSKDFCFLCDNPISCLLWRRYHLNPWSGSRTPCWAFRFLCCVPSSLFGVWCPDDVLLLGMKLSRGKPFPNWEETFSNPKCNRFETRLCAHHCPYDICSI